MCTVFHALSGSYVQNIIFTKCAQQSAWSPQDSVQLYLVPVSSGSVTDIALIIWRLFLCGGGSPHSKEGGPRPPGKGEGWGTRGTRLVQE